MSEFSDGVLSFQAFLIADLVAATPKETQPVSTLHYRMKTIAVISDQAGQPGPPTDLSVDVLVKLRDGKWWPLKDAMAGVCTAGTVFTFSFADVFEQVKVRFTPGVVLPGRVCVQFNASRGG